MTTLDERTGALLERLGDLCTGGGYHLLEEADLAGFVPEGTLPETLSYLADSYVKLPVMELLPSVIADSTVG